MPGREIVKKSTFKKSIDFLEKKRIIIIVKRKATEIDASQIQNRKFALVL